MGRVSEKIEKGVRDKVIEKLIVNNHQESSRGKLELVILWCNSQVLVISFIFYLNRLACSLSITYCSLSAIRVSIPLIRST